MRQSKRGWRLGLVAAVLTATLTLRLLSRLAMPPAAAHPVDPVQAEDMIAEFQNLCRAKGGILGEYDTADGSVELWCEFPTYTANCWFQFDNQVGEIDEVDCWDDELGAPAGQTIGGGSGNGSVWILPTPRSGPGAEAGSGRAPVNAPIDPGAAPTPMSGPAGIGKRPVISGVNAPPNLASAPSPTPTRPGRSVLGGVLQIHTPVPKSPVEVTPTQPATGQTDIVLVIFQSTPPSELAPPENGNPEIGNPEIGNSSGIHVTGWTCPRDVGQNLSLSQLVAACTVPDTIDFEVNGPVHKLIHGGIELIKLPAGTYDLAEHIPANFTLSYAFCAVGSASGPPPNQLPATVANGHYEVTLGEHRALYCNWFNVYAPIASPVSTRPGSAVLGGSAGNSGVAHAVAPVTTPPATAPAGTPVP